MTTPSESEPRKPTGMAQRVVIGCLSVLGFFLLCFAIGALFGGWGLPRRQSTIDTRPVLVAMQKLGELHTYSMSLKNVLSHETDQEPEGWIRNLPGAVGITKWATRNRATVTAEGTVEAGLDLSQIKPEDITLVRLADGKQQIQVRLPPIKVYPPNVRVDVDSAQSGLFWNDKNLIPKAEAEAARRFQEAAEQDGIRQKAETAAIETLQKMQATFGHDHIEFTFNRG